MRCLVTLFLCQLCFMLFTPVQAQSLRREPPVNSTQSANVTSGTVGTFTVAVPLSTGDRTGCQFANTGTGTLYVFARHLGTSPSVAASFPVATGGVLACARGEQDEMDVAASVASLPYVVSVQ